MFLSALLRQPSRAMISMPVRPYMLQWLPKYKETAYPTYFDSPMRRWDSAMKTRKYGYYS